MTTTKMIQSQYDADTLMLVARPGVVLPNGATVVKAQAKALFPGDDNPCVVVLCVRDDYHMPFVTWKMAYSTKNTFWGNYFKTLEEALEDFKARLM